jgi:DNA polymerase-3 subunit epsilon
MAEDPQAFAVVDVETTGTERYSDRIVSVGVVRLDAACRVVDRWGSLVNPERPMGATHIHGLTDEMVARAPTFAAVAPELRGRLDGSVLVGHNLAFDWGFITIAFARSGHTLDDHRGICTLELTRSLRFDLPDAKLDTVAGALGIPLDRDGHHDSLEDATVTAKVFAILYAEAVAGDVDFMTLLRQDAPPQMKALPKSVYENPRRSAPGGPLVQGMHMAITGETHLPREELVARAHAAGLDVTSSVTAKTGLVVTNDPRTTTAKATKARELGIWVADEATLLRLLDDVHPGKLRKEHRNAGTLHAPAVVTRAPGNGALTGQRVLLLGEFDDALVLATRIRDAGGEPAQRVSKAVTMVVCGQGAEPNRLASALGYGAEQLAEAELLALLTGEAQAAAIPAGAPEPAGAPAPAAAPASAEATPSAEPPVALPEVQSALATSAAHSSPEPGWYADPHQRYPWRFWDGAVWTAVISAYGQTYTDPLG